MVKHMQKALGSEFLEAASRYDIRLEDGVRWGSLQARCEEEREKRGLSLKAVSLDLNIPQYRIQAIEKGSLRYVRPDFAHRYFRYLQIESWVTRWARMNVSLARRAGLTPFPKRTKENR
jgi:hypothetical protein